MTDRFSQLTDDAIVRVLSFLEVIDLCHIAQVSTQCSELSTTDECWAAHVDFTICSRYKLDRRDFEGNFLHLIETGSAFLPRYSGPPLRMPYLTPDNEGIKITEEGLCYRCYPSAQSQLPRGARTDHVWITHKYPVTCCGAILATRAEMEAHRVDMRHYERMQALRGEGRLPDRWIDPRLLLGEAAFAALPKRFQCLRVQDYVDAILPEIEARCEPANWSEADHARLRRLSEQGLGFMEDLVRDQAFFHDDGEEYLADVVEECRRDCHPLAIGTHVCNAALETFEELGVYSEAVPYFSARDLLVGGLAECDPDGGSASGEHWWRGVSEIFRYHYDCGWGERWFT